VLKQRVLAGEFGRPIQFKGYVSWPRTWKYYGRNAWAGKLKTSDGALVRDSVASNATSHYIQNMLFMLGPSMEESAPLSNVQAECYRANDIESFDTIAFKGRAGGADVFYVATHAVNYTIQPTMDYIFENARITINLASQEYECVIHHKDGRIEKMGHISGARSDSHLRAMARRISGQEAYICTAETVRPFTMFMDDIFTNVPIADFPKNMVITDHKAQATYVKNLHMDLLDCYNAVKLPSELGGYINAQKIQL